MPSPNPKISVIVPVYNTEKYLRRCIDSILAQTFTDFELLLINDGSRDSSGAICDEYAAKDSRVRVFHKENGGVSSARNVGLDNAKGEWVIFCDSDDYWICSFALEKLYRFVQQNTIDIVRGEYIEVNFRGEQLSQKENNIRNEYADQILSVDVFFDKILCGEFFLCLCLIKRRLLAKIRFDTSMIFLEDMKVFLQLLLQNPRCAYLTIDFYAYRKLKNSASSQHNQYKLRDAFSMCDYIWMLKERCKELELCVRLGYYSVMMYYWTLQTLASMPYYNKRHVIIKDLQLNAIHKRVLTRLNKVRGVNWKYYFFILPPVRFGVRLLHLKDNVRALMS